MKISTSSESLFSLASIFTDFQLIQEKLVVITGLRYNHFHNSSSCASSCASPLDQKNVQCYAIDHSKFLLIKKKKKILVVVFLESI